MAIRIKIEIVSRVCLEMYQEPFNLEEQLCATVLNLNMERTIKINRRLIIAFLAATILYLCFRLYQEVSIELDWMTVGWNVFLIGVFLWSIFMEHLKKLNQAFEISLLGILFFIGLFALLAMVSYLTYY